MKVQFLTALMCIAMTTPLFSQSADQEIVLNKPNLERGLPLMETLAIRASAREFSSKNISKSDLSDLLWAANGVNREDGKRTAPSAMNKQEIDVYAFTKQGAYKYDAQNNKLILIAAGDHRKLIEAGQEYVMDAPLSLVLVGDTNKFSNINKEKALSMTTMDSGIVSQNISLFCAAVGLANIPRISMDVAAVSKLLKLQSGQIPLMNNVVGYNK